MDPAEEEHNTGLAVKLYISKIEVKCSNNTMIKLLVVVIVIKVGQTRKEELI